jgi:hypothetical protein
MPTKQTAPSRSALAAATVIISSVLHCPVAAAAADIEIPVMPDRR